MLTHCELKVCPILMAASLANPDRVLQFENMERHRVCCMGEDCAWWRGSGCVLAWLDAAGAGSLPAQGGAEPRRPRRVAARPS